MEMILLGAKQPEAVLLGDVDPLNRQQYLGHLFQASGALLGSYLTKKLLHKETMIEDGIAIDVESDDKKISVSFDSRFYAKTFDIHENTGLPWIYPQENRETILLPGSKLCVMVRPRSSGHIRIFFSEDIKILKTMAKQYRNTNTKLAIMYPQDFQFLDKSEQDNIVKQIHKLGAILLVCPEILEAIDSTAIDKLHSSQLMRR
jgi:hypothetical protein